MYLLAHIVLLTAIQTRPAQAIGPRTQITNVTCMQNSQFIANLTCWLSPENKINVDLQINRTLSLGLRTTITVEHQIPNSEKYQTLLNYDVDTCKTIKNIMRSSLTSIWFGNVQKFGSLLSPCPIKSGYYDLRNFYLEDSSIPVYVRPGNYRLEILIYFGKPNAKVKAKRRRLVESICVQFKLY